MQSRVRYTIVAVVMALLFSVTTDSLAQRRSGGTIDPVLRGNPRRDAGGSCVYDRNGRVVFAPEGKECRDRRDHLTKNGREDSEVLRDYPPAMREDLARLLNDHDHIAEEVARLRTVIRQGKRDEALKAAEKISREITDHTAREERFIEQLGPASKAYND